MEIYKTFTFDSAHQLFLPYDSKCNELHGHTYKIEVWIKGTVNKETGLIADFTHIKKMINDNYDHKNLNQIPPFLNKNIPTTAENIATEIMLNIFVKFGFPCKVRIWETSNSYAEADSSELK